MTLGLSFDANMGTAQARFYNRGRETSLLVLEISI